MLCCRCLYVFLSCPFFVGTTGVAVAAFKFFFSGTHVWPLKWAAFHRRFVLG